MNATGKSIAKGMVHIYVTAMPLGMYYSMYSNSKFMGQICTNDVCTRVYTPMVSDMTVSMERVGIRLQKEAIGNTLIPHIEHWDTHEWYR